jgi:hypothetical protein
MYTDTPTMSLPLEDIERNTRQPEAKPTKVSKIPSRPGSRRENSQNRQIDFSVSTTGSPRPTGIPPTARTTMSLTANSRIPTVPQTPMNTPVIRGFHSKSGGGQRSSLPVPCREQETSTKLIQPVGEITKKTELLQLIFIGTE